MEIVFISQNHWHHASEKNADGTPVRVRRMGNTKLWKTRPTHFSIPVKYGMYEAFRLTHENQHEWHPGDAHDCTLCPAPA